MGFSISGPAASNEQSSKSLLVAGHGDDSCYISDLGNLVGREMGFGRKEEVLPGSLCIVGSLELSEGRHCRTGEISGVQWREKKLANQTDERGDSLIQEDQQLLPELWIADHMMEPFHGGRHRPRRIAHHGEIRIQRHGRVRLALGTPIGRRRDRQRRYGHLVCRAGQRSRVARLGPGEVLRHGLDDRLGLDGHGRWDRRVGRRPLLSGPGAALFRHECDAGGFRDGDGVLFEEFGVCKDFAFE